MVITVALSKKRVFIDIVFEIMKGDMFETLKRKHKRQSYSSGRVQNLEHALLTVNVDLFTVTVFDSRIILLHEDILHKLYRESRFP